MKRNNPTARKERGLICRGPEALAIWQGRQAQVRRLVRPQPNNPETFGVSPIWGQGVPCFMDGKPVPEGKRRFCVHAAFNEGGKRVDRWLPCPFGRVGDLIFVKEPHGFLSGAGKRLVYAADGAPKDRFSGEEIPGMKWRPATHMTREHTRSARQLAEIRIEKLTDISEADAIAQGIQPNSEEPGMYRNYGECELEPPFLAPVYSFETLWESLNGPGSWGPHWVWVLTLTAVEIER